MELKGHVLMVRSPFSFPPWCSWECGFGVEAFGACHRHPLTQDTAIPWDSSRNAYLHSPKVMSSNLCCRDWKLTLCCNPVKELYFISDGDIERNNIGSDNHNHNKKEIDKSRPHRMIPLITDIVMLTN